MNYQARIDGKGLQSGEKDFTRLPNLYVLTVTDFDPFGEGKMVYTVHNMCEEVPELKYEDGLRFYYFYTDGQKDGNEELRTVLRYMKDSRAVDAATRGLHGYVEKVKIRPEVRVAYMRLGLPSVSSGVCQTSINPLPTSSFFASFKAVRFIPLASDKSLSLW